MSVVNVAACPLMLLPSLPLLPSPESACAADAQASDTARAHVFIFMVSSPRGFLERRLGDIVRRLKFTCNPMRAFPHGGKWTRHGISYPLVRATRSRREWIA